MRYGRVKDPEEFLRDPPPGAVALGLDLGTNCGYALSVREKGGWSEYPWQLGQLDLSAGAYDSGAIRFVRLRHFLTVLKPQIIFYESVKFTPSEAITKYSAHRVLSRAATASEFLGGLKVTLCTWAEEAELPCVGFEIGTIKKFATGKGNAGKEAMIRACNERYGTDLDAEGYESSGVDNVADAAHVLALGLSQYGKGIS